MGFISNFSTLCRKILSTNDAFLTVPLGFSFFWNCQHQQQPFILKCDQSTSSIVLEFHYYSMIDMHSALKSENKCNLGKLLCLYQRLKLAFLKVIIQQLVPTFVIALFFHFRALWQVLCLLSEYDSVAKRKISSWTSNILIISTAMPILVSSYIYSGFRFIFTFDHQTGNFTGHIWGGWSAMGGSNFSGRWRTGGV